MSNEHREHDHAELQEEHDHGVPEPLQYIDEPDDHDHDHDHDDHEGHHHGHEPTILDPAQHRAEGVALFNAVWQMLDADDRTPEQADQMVHAAHASRWHWSQAAELGGDQQLAVGEWQCSRVYSVIGRGEPALHHAKACLAICEETGQGARLARKGAGGCRGDCRSRGPRGDRLRPGRAGSAADPGERLGVSCPGVSSRQDDPSPRRSR